ncbi:MAG: hypothetical protein ACK4N5_10700 [Myxococcales bacterium]
MGITNDLKKQAFKLSGKAMEKLFADEKRAMQIAKAVGAVQKGKKVIESAQDDVLNALGFANRSDYKELGKRISALKRRARDLTTKVDKL